MDKDILEKSGILAVVITFAVLAFWFGFSKISLGAEIDQSTWTKAYMKKDSVVYECLIILKGTGSPTIVFGTQTNKWIGTSTDPTLATLFLNTATGNLEWKPPGTTTSYPFGSVTADYVATQIGLAGANYVQKNDGLSTRQLLTDPIFAGFGTITASFGVNGLVITPQELAMVDGGIGTPFQGQIDAVEGTMSTHAHTGGDGTTQVSHNDVMGTGSISHTNLDTFYNSKAQASGIASLDANGLVVQNPASGTSTPGASKILISLGTGLIGDSWLSSAISKLGQTIELGTETTGNTDNVSEGSTNKYYTDVRVNAAVGSLSVNTASDVNIAMNENDIVKISGGQLVAGSSSVAAAWADLTGTPANNGSTSVTGKPGNLALGGDDGRLHSSWMSSIFQLPGTTTVPPIGTATVYVQITPVTYPSSYELKLLCNNPGTNTFTDSSSNSYSVVASGNVIGTSSSKYGLGAALYDGTGDFVTIGTATNWSFLHMGTSTVDIQIKSDSFASNRVLYNTWDGNATTAGIALYLTTTRTIHVWNHKNGAYCINSPTTGTYPNDTTNYHHIRVTSDYSLPTNQLIVYIDGVSVGTFTTSSAVGTGETPIEALSFGKSTGGEPAFLGKQDSIFVADTRLCTTNFTPPISEIMEEGGTQNLYQYTYLAPETGQALMVIQTGTGIMNPSYCLVNASITAYGAGTTTGIPSDYQGYYTGPIRITAVDIASTKEIKENIEEIKIKPVWLDAENIAKKQYISGTKTAWVANNQYKYKSIVNPTGTGTVVVLDTIAMESAFSEYVEIEWASMLNRNAIIEDVQIEKEREFWNMFDNISPRSWNPKKEPNITRKGFVVEESPPEILGKDKASIDPMALIAYYKEVLHEMKRNIVLVFTNQNIILKALKNGTYTPSEIETSLVEINDKLEVLNP